MRYKVSYLMDEIWERAVETALDGQTDRAAARTLTLDGAVKCVLGRLPPPSLLEKFPNLHHLSIANIGVSTLEQFPRLPNLQKLILSDNRIAGGLKFLVEAGLDSLRDLDLSNNRIQFIEDLEPLAPLKLVSLDLYECPVTRAKDYRSRVFGLIKSLKYLDKMDSEENERPESEDEEEEEEEEEEEDDPGSGEVDGVDQPYRIVNGHNDGVEGVVDVDEDEESDADEEETEISRQVNGTNHQANGFHVVPVEVEDAGEYEDGDDEEDNESVEEIDEEEGGDDDDAVEVHEIDDSDDEEGGVEYNEDDDDDDEEDDDEDEEVDNEEGDFAEPESTGRLVSTEGEIDGHEQGEDGGDEDDNGETEEEQGIEEDVEYEDEEDGEEEDEVYGSGYLVQPVVQAALEEEEGGGGLDMGPVNEDSDEDEEEEVEDDEEVEVIQPSSSQPSKRKREEEEAGEEDEEEDEDEDIIEHGKSTKKHR